MKGKWITHLNERVISSVGDAGYYTARSWWLAQFLRGMPTNDFLMGAIFCEYGYSGYLFLLASFYCFFGYSPFSATLLNCTISVLTGITLYFIAKEASDLKTARITAVLCIFFPSLVLWSINNLKDSLYIFLTTLILWSYLKLIKAFRIRHLLLIIFSLLLQHFIRNYLPITIFTAGILIFCFLIYKNKKTLILLFIISTVFISLRFNFSEIKNTIISYQLGVVGTGGSTYQIYDDWVYDPHIDKRQISYKVILKGLARGWFHHFLEPFPWKISSKLSMAAFPQMLIWYFLLPFSVWGILIQLKFNWRKNAIFIIYLFIIGSVLSLTGGNIGTVFRARDMLTPIFLFFSSVSLSKIF